MQSYLVIQKDLSLTYCQQITMATLKVIKKRKKITKKETEIIPLSTFTLYRISEKRLFCSVTPLILKFILYTN